MAVWKTSWFDNSGQLVHNTAQGSLNMGNKRQAFLIMKSSKPLVRWAAYRVTSDKHCLSKQAMGFGGLGRTK